jgi:hypothetical protein
VRDPDELDYNLKEHYQAFWRANNLSYLGHALGFAAAAVVFGILLVVLRHRTWQDIHYYVWAAFGINVFIFGAVAKSSENPVDKK